MYIAFIALTSAFIIVDNPATHLSLQDFHPETFSSTGISALLAIAGTFITAWLLIKNIRGAFLLGIIITWILGMICQAFGIYQVSPEHNCLSLYPQLSLSTLPDAFSSFGNLFGALFETENWTRTGVESSGWNLLLSLNFITIIFALLFTDLFDTLGTLIGVSTKCGLLDQNGRLPRIKGALLADSLATSAGAIFGAPTTTTYLESSAGASAGGRTGLTACTTAILFLMAILLAPVFLAVPSFATAPALILVGFQMISILPKIRFDDYTDAIPAYLTILIMPLSYSISDGICAGIISWTILNVLCGKHRKVSLLMYILTVIFIAKYFCLA